MTAKRDEELTQEFTEWMALGIEHDAHVFAWLQASSSRVLEYLRKESEHAKLARTPDELTIYNMEWELSDKDDEIAQLKAQLDLRPTAAVPLEATPPPISQEEPVSIPAIVVTSTAQALEAPAPVMTASDSPALTTAAPAWNLINPPNRTPGYRWPLYHFLKAAHVAGKPCPKAQDVLNDWKLNPPHGGLHVIPSGRRDALEYKLDHGGVKNADLKAIQASINGLIVSIASE